MNKEQVVVVGGGGHAKVLISILRKMKNLELLGYSDIKNNGRILGVEYFGDDNFIIENTSRDVKLVLGIGQLKSNRIRRAAIVDSFVKKGFVFETVLSPDAVINEGVDIDRGTVVIDGAVINSGTRIGKFSIVNTSSSVDHDCTIGDYVHIAPGCTLCGGVKVGDGAFLGAGSIIPEYREVPAGSFIKAGSLFK